MSQRQTAGQIPPRSNKRNGIGRAAGPSFGRNRWATVIVCVALAAAVAAVFGQTVAYDFVNYDDNDYVSDNARVQQGLSGGGIAWAFTTFRAANWHPLTWLSHELDCQLYGLHPWGHHLTNVVLHAAAAILLFLALRHDGGFVAQRVRGGVVCRPSVAGRIGGMDCGTQGRFERRVVHGDSVGVAGYTRRPDSRGRYGTVLVLFALGLMAKPSLVTVPLVLLLVDYWPLGRFAAAGRRPGEPRLAGASWVVLLREKIPLLVLSAASCVVTLVARRKAVMSLEKVSFPTRIANVLVSYARYVSDFFCPTGLAVFYPHPQDGWALWQVVGAALLLTGVTAVVLLARRRCPYLPVGWFWYLAMLVPMIGLVQVGMQAKADRYTYLSQIGFAVAAAWGGAAAVRAAHRFADGAALPRPR